MRDAIWAAAPYATISVKCTKDMHTLSGKDSIKALSRRKAGSISPSPCDLSARPMSSDKSRKTSAADFGGYAQARNIPPTTHLPTHARTQFPKYRGCAIRARGRFNPIRIGISRRVPANIAGAAARRIRLREHHAVLTLRKVRQLADSLGRTYSLTRSLGFLWNY